MKTIQVIAAGMALSVAGAAFAAQPLAVTVDIANDTRGHDVPETLWGGFLEEINYAITGGLYPELIANRGFDWGTGKLEGWEFDARGGGMARLTRQNGRPVHEATATHLRIESFGAGTGVGVRNRGYHGIWLEAGKKYDLTFYARGLDGYAGGFRAVIEAAVPGGKAPGETLFEYAVANSDMIIGAKSGLSCPPLPEWKRYATVVTAKRTGFVTFSLLLDAAGTVEFEQVSLFPQDTWGGRKNGLRKDLVQLMKDYGMKFIRYPGGCYCEGQEWSDWFDWKLSVGDGTLESRRCIWDLWGYWNEMGMGYYEYLLLCEDIGAEPLPVVNVGITCQGRGPKFAPRDSTYFAEAACDLVEFTTGDAKTTKWGALRAKMGHPAPFKLRFIELSNEQWGPEYIARAKVVSTALRARYPKLQIIGDVHDGRGYSREYAWKNLTRKEVDILDEHFYQSAAWFRQNSRHYDGRPRKDDLPKIYIGEYACRDWGHAKAMIARGICSKARTSCSMPRNALHGALSEAMTLVGFERNSDIVKMTSYSPMFCKEDQSYWTPGFIWIRNEGCYASTSYYAHRMFSSNRPTYLVPSELTCGQPLARKGRLALYTWQTAVEIGEVTVVDADGRVLFKGLPDPATCQTDGEGKWEIKDGVLRQTNVTGTEGTRLWFGDAGWGDVKVSFRFRRTSGDEGVIIGFFGGAKDRPRIDVDIAGYTNTRHALYLKGCVARGKVGEKGVCETGRWYEVTAETVGNRVRATLDGREVIAANVGAADDETFEQVCGIDEKTNELIVKLVNVSAAPRAVTLRFAKPLAAGEVTRQVLTGDRLALNTLQEPTKCATVETKVPFAGGATWAVELPAWSLTVYRLKR